MKNQIDKFFYNSRLSGKIFLFLLVYFLFSSNVFATPALQLVKNLNLSVNSPHILIFDEKIIRYQFQNENEIKAEILPNIFNYRQELLIKPIRKLNNKLTVWTQSRIYNFNISFDSNSPADFPEDNCGMIDFPLDSPPKTKN